MSNRDSTLMTPSEVAAIFGVNPKTITKWSNEGRLTCVRTLGGHRRFERGAVNDLLRESQKEN